MEAGKYKISSEKRVANKLMIEAQGKPQSRKNSYNEINSKRYLNIHLPRMKIRNVRRNVGKVYAFYALWAHHKLWSYGKKMLSSAKSRVPFNFLKRI